MDNENDKILLKNILDLLIEHSKKNYRKLFFLNRIIVIIFCYIVKIIVKIFGKRAIDYFLITCNMKDKFNNVVIQKINSERR